MPALSRPSQNPCPDAIREIFPVQPHRLHEERIKRPLYSHMVCINNSCSGFSTQSKSILGRFIMRFDRIRRRFATILIALSVLAPSLGWAASCNLPAEWQVSQARSVAYDTGHTTSSNSCTYAGFPPALTTTTCRYPNGGSEILTSQPFETLPNGQLKISVTSVSNKVPWYEIQGSGY